MAAEHHQVRFATHGSTGRPALRLTRPGTASETPEKQAISRRHLRASRTRTDTISAENGHDQARAFRAVSTPVIPSLGSGESGCVKRSAPHSVEPRLRGSFKSRQSDAGKVGRRVDQGSLALIRTKERTERPPGEHLAREARRRHRRVGLVAWRRGQARPRNRRGRAGFYRLDPGRARSGFRGHALPSLLTPIPRSTATNTHATHATSAMVLGGATGMGRDGTSARGRRQHQRQHARDQHRPGAGGTERSKLAGPQGHGRVLNQAGSVRESASCIVARPAGVVKGLATALPVRERPIPPLPRVQKRGPDARVASRRTIFARTRAPRSDHGNWSFAETSLACAERGLRFWRRIRGRARRALGLVPIGKNTNRRPTRQTGQDRPVAPR